MDTFTSQVEDWVLETEQRITAVYRKAAELLFESVLARTPVDTGFLRASFQVTLGTTIPTLSLSATRNEAGGFNIIQEPIAFVIATADLGDTIVGAFTANYAGHVEFGANGRPGVAMVRLSAQEWQQFVDEATSQLRSRLGR